MKSVEQKYASMQEIFIKNKSKTILEVIGPIIYFSKDNKVFAAYWEEGPIWYDGVSGLPKYRYITCKLDDVISLFDMEDQKLIFFNLDLFL